MLTSFSQTYVAGLSAALQKLDHEAIARATFMLMEAWREGRAIYLFGNGGSAATASHMMTDLSMIDTRGMPPIRAIALTDNVSHITAWSNDTGYENAFARPLQNVCKPGDVCIAISCSGNSKNVLRAVAAAKSMGAKVIAFTGDTGGALAGLADVCLYAPHPHIGAQEDIHLALDHLISQSLRNWIARVAELNARELKALVLAAGEGTRLRPLTLDKPKPMIPVNGKPVLQHILEWLVSQRVRQIAINLNYMPQAITGYFGDGALVGAQLTYAHEPAMLGTAGAVKNLEAFWGADPFVVAYGDVLTDLDLRELYTLHNQMLALHPALCMTMSLYRVPDPTRVGIVGLDAAHRVTQFVEKPAANAVFSDLANSGVLIVEPRALAHIPPNTFYDFGLHLIPDLLAKGELLCGSPIPPHTYLLDIGSRENLALAEMTFGRATFSAV